MAVIAAVVLRRVRGISTETAPSSGSSGMWWIYAGVPLTVAALVVALVWTMQVMAAVDAPAGPRAL